MIEEFLAAKRNEGRYCANTLILVAGWLERCRLYFEPRPLLALKPGDFQDWHHSLSWVPGPSGRLYAPNTINQAVGALRLYYSWALTEGLVSANPMVALKTPAIKGRPRWQPSTTEARKLLGIISNDTAPGIRDRAIMGILFETGIPVQVCSRLDLGHLQMDTGMLLAIGRARGMHSLSDGLLDDLERYLQQARPLLVRAPSQALLLNVQGERLTAAAIRVRLSGYRSRLKP